MLGVVGGGTMGSGIAQLAASKGLDVVLWDITEELATNALQRIRASVNRSVEKGRLTVEEGKETLDRIHVTSTLESISGADMVIEAIIEDPSAKQDMFSKLDQVLHPNAIIASNTSGISITLLGRATSRPDKVVGIHFFNPAPVMRLVEVVRGYHSSDESVCRAVDLAEQLGKTPVVVKKDTPGFIVNRIMTVQFIEAIRLVEEGVASIEDIDKAVTLGLNYPMGPFALQDMGGLDVGLSVMDYFYEEFKDDRYAAPQSLRRLVRAGRLGRKTGAGWYEY
ncbi:3-hydroxyacyl-CoA dehydrogenase family protein [Alicyclobacillus kakegawensis]|uniref:3-hydroxyacyl-CoA dehydrogenase family protein n=1 Tax=Alicyclobacillus kakegawensis TaxID=392012 RepID=UPI000B1BA875|nr:3-hydroxyacyl-CoA dehydrogenase family protein [Alicyclobacillus kakegawensis]